jgi:hypothetical protein
MVLWIVYYTDMFKDVLVNQIGFVEWNAFSWNNTNLKTHIYVIVVVCKALVDTLLDIYKDPKQIETDTDECREKQKDN